MPIQQPIDYQPAIDNKRVNASLTKEIKAAKDKIFPLVCPVEELRWIPNWEYNLLHSKSGVNETNCIFTEEKSGPVLFDAPVIATWITAKHNQENGHVLFQIILENRGILHFDFQIREVGKDICSCIWDMTFSALDEESNAKTDEEIIERIKLIIGFLSETLTHYCEAGEMLNLV